MPDGEHPSPIVAPGPVENVQLTRADTADVSLLPQRAAHRMVQGFPLTQKGPW